MTCTKKNIVENMTYIDEIDRSNRLLTWYFHSLAWADQASSLLCVLTSAVLK